MRTRRAMSALWRSFIGRGLVTGFVLLFCGGVCGRAQPGSLDPAFHRYSIFDKTVFASAVDADGKVILGGAFTKVTGAPRNGIARFTATGTLDETFNPGIGVEGAGALVNAVAVYTNGTHLGKIIIGGSFTQVDRVARPGVARLNADGSLDTSFDPGTGVEDGDVYAVAIQSDGKVLVGGDFTTVAQKARSGIARFNANGSVDSNFNPGTGADGPVYAIVVQKDGKIVLGGAFAAFRGADRAGVARLTSSGSLDSTGNFDPGTGAEDGSVYALALQADGKIILGGDFTYFQGEPRDGVARLNPNGSIDTGFAPSTGGNIVVTVWAVAAAEAGKVVAAGEFTTIANAPADGIVRLNPDGRQDATFTNTRPDTVVFNVGHGEYVLTLAVQNDGSLIAGGTFEMVDNLYRPGLVRILTNGMVDRVYNQESGTFDAVLASAVQPDGKIVLGGQFTLANGESRRGLARLNADGLLDTGFTVGSGAIGRVLALQAFTNGPQVGKIVIGGTFTNVNGFTVSGLALINTNGSVDMTFNPTVQKSEVDALALQSDGKIVIGGPFTRVNGVPRNGVARLNLDGSLDTSFNPGSGMGGEAIYSLAVQNDGAVVIAGDFLNFNGVARQGIARLTSVGALDTGFNPGSGLAGGAAYALLVQPNGQVIAGGGFTNANNVARGGIARFEPNGNVDATFNPGDGVAGGEIRSMALQTNGQILIGGSFTAFNHIPSGGVARLNANGGFDYGFDPGTGVSRGKETVYTLALQRDGKVIMGGSFLAVDGVEIWGVTRLLGGGATPTPPILEWWPEQELVLSGDPGSIEVIAGGSKPLGYQWFYGGKAMKGETNSVLMFPSVTTNQAGSYMVGITNTYGAVTSPPIVLNVIPTVDLPGALDAPQLPWTISGDQRWYGQTIVAHSGGAAGQSGPLKDDQGCSLSTTVTGPGWLTFWWKVSSEQDYDLLEFRVNGTVLDSISGEVDWAQRTFEIPTGDATLTWAYSKDQVYSVGEDAGWLDGVSYVEAPLLTPAMTTNQLFQLEIQAAPGQQMEIQTSTTLTNWTTLAVLTNSTSPLRFVDLASTNYTRRFYRTVTP